MSVPVSMSGFPDVADELGVIVTQVHQLVRDGQLIALRGEDGVRRIPADFIQDGVIVKGVVGVINVLRDAKFSDTEIVDWLHREDDSLPGTPIQALRENRGTEVKRRAQAAGY
ncbi:hypothetical protein SAMN05444157_1944 [Frankineae bacterium MT45]|nr:hypothetical protein SAMN05444157_1944 [Frankineae bacterium MT45]